MPCNAAVEWWCRVLVPIAHITATRLAPFGSQAVEWCCRERRLRGLPLPTHSADTAHFCQVRASMPRTSSSLVVAACFAVTCGCRAFRCPVLVSRAIAAVASWHHMLHCRVWVPCDPTMAGTVSLGSTAHCWYCALRCRSSKPCDYTAVGHVCRALRCHLCLPCAPMPWANSRSAFCCRVGAVAS